MQFALLLAMVSLLFGNPIVTDSPTPEIETAPDIETAPSDYWISALNPQVYPVDSTESNGFNSDNSGRLGAGLTFGAANTLEKPDNLFLNPDRDAAASGTSTSGNILIGSDTSIVNTETTAQNTDAPCLDDGTTKTVNKVRRGWPWDIPLVCPTPDQNSIAPIPPMARPVPQPPALSPPSPVQKKNPEPKFDGGPTYTGERERSCRGFGSVFSTVICGGRTEPPNAIDYADVVYDCWRCTYFPIFINSNFLSYPSTIFICSTDHMGEDLIMMPQIINHLVC